MSDSETTELRIDAIRKFMDRNYGMRIANKRAVELLAAIDAAMSAGMAIEARRQNPAMDATPSRESSGNYRIISNG